MDRAARRKEMLAYCLKVLDQSDPIYAMHAADWYEANEPQDLDGLGQRVRREIEKRRAADASRRQG